MEELLQYEREKLLYLLRLTGIAEQYQGSMVDRSNFTTPVFPMG